MRLVRPIDRGAFIPLAVGREGQSTRQQLHGDRCYSNTAPRQRGRILNELLEGVLVHPFPLVFRKARKA